MRATVEDPCDCAAGVSARGASSLWIRARLPSRRVDCRVPWTIDVIDPQSGLSHYFSLHGDEADVSRKQYFCASQKCLLGDVACGGLFGPLYCIYQALIELIENALRVAVWQAPRQWGKLSLHLGHRRGQPRGLCGDGKTDLKTAISKAAFTACFRLRQPSREVPESRNIFGICSFGGQTRGTDANSRRVVCHITDLTRTLSHQPPVYLLVGQSALYIDVASPAPTPPCQNKATRSKTGQGMKERECGDAELIGEHRFRGKFVPR